MTMPDLIINLTKEKNSRNKIKDMFSKINSQSQLMENSTINDKTNRNENRKDIEQLFNHIKNLNWKLNDENKKELMNFALERKININKKISEKDTYLTFSLLRKIIKDDKSISKTFILKNKSKNDTFNQQELISRNESCINSIVNNEQKIRNIICSKNFEPD